MVFGGTAMNAGDDGANEPPLYWSWILTWVAPSHDESALSVKSTLVLPMVIARSDPFTFTLAGAASAEAGTIAKTSKANANARRMTPFLLLRFVCCMLRPPEWFTTMAFSQFNVGCVTHGDAYFFHDTTTS